MSKERNIGPLAHNLRYLRKKHKLSQSALAEQLDIRRSNVAAYEIKNVEPRLRVLLKISDFFSLPVRTLIESKLDDDTYASLSQGAATSEKEPLISIRNRPEIQEFVDKSVKIHKVLEGFKAFYRFKKEKISSEHNEDVYNIMHDIENFIGLMEHLLHYNESIIKTLQDNSTPSSETEGEENNGSTSG